MSKKRSPKGKSDHFTRKAKQDGYPARSVYKLEEIQKKYSIIGKGARVLDIGAAPGSWSLYVSKRIHTGGPERQGKLVSVDLNPLDESIRKTVRKNGNDTLILEGDAFEEPVYSRIVQAGPYDVIMSDAAPSTTGNRTVDAGRSFTLAMRILEAASHLLVPGGNLVVKIFQGGDEKEILDRMKELFSMVKAHKPKASRKPSFETYYVGKNKSES